MRNLKSLITILFLLISFSSFSQNGREYIREQIEVEGNCRNVAITKTNGDLMLYGVN